MNELLGRVYRVPNPAYDKIGQPKNEPSAMELSADEVIGLIDELKRNQFLVTNVLAISMYEALAKQPGVDAEKLKADLVNSFEVYRGAFADRQFAHECLSAMSENLASYESA